MTQTTETQLEREKAKKKKQAEQDELLMLAFMAGNMGAAFRMEAAAAAGGE
jgi:hypothetical protein